MYQVKFLKPLSLKAISSPSASSSKAKKTKSTHLELSSTLTISNDLGESNFYGSITLKVTTKHTLRASHLAKSIVLDKSLVQWDAGKRAVNFNVVFPIKQLKAFTGYISLDVDVDENSKVLDHLNTEGTTTSELITELIPSNTLELFKGSSHFKTERVSKLKIFSISSDFIDVPKSFDDVTTIKTDRMSIRKINEDIQLYEELSGSIARHLWDAGLLIVEGVQIEELLKFINGSTNKNFQINDNLDILELGTGIGLVSIHLKKKLTNSRVLSTDLLDAKEIYDNNLRLNGLLDEPSILFDELDWELSEKTDRSWDLIIITDCTYNPLYYDPLIKVLEKEVFKETIVLIVHKFREPLSESEFFEKISKSNFSLKSCKIIDQNGQYLIFIGLYVKIFQ